jgi:hypothetical protein
MAEQQFTLLCDGPGPHVTPNPKDPAALLGVVGYSSTDPAGRPSGMRCASAKCRPLEDTATVTAEVIRARLRTYLAGNAVWTAATPAARAANLDNLLVSILKQLSALERLQLAELDTAAGT